MKKIFILGAGAIGKALAVFLKLQQKDVILIRGSVDNKTSSHEEIEVLTANNVVLKSTLEISTLSNFQNLDGLIVLTTKSFGNIALADNLKSKAGSSPIIILQNGLDVEKPFLENFSSVYRCVLFATSQLISPSTVRFKPVSFSPLGIIKGNLTQLDSIANALDTSNFHFKAVDNIQEIIWKKVIANCVFNSICALLDTDNGIFYRDADALALAKHVIAECTAIARTQNIHLRDTEVTDTVLMISKSSDGQLISTLQDLKNNRETEIESLNLAIVRVADQMNNGHLVPITRMLGELIKLKSKMARG